MPYTVRPGSIADRALRMLATEGPMTARDIADDLDVDVKSVMGKLTFAWRDGIVIRREITVEYARSTVALWALANQAELLAKWIRVDRRHVPREADESGPTADAIADANPFRRCA